MDGWFYLTWMWTLDCKSVSNDWHDHCWLGQHGWFYMILDVNSWFCLFDNFWLTDFWERTGTGGSLKKIWNKGHRLFPWFPFPKNLSQRGSSMFFLTGNRRFLIHSHIVMIWLLGMLSIIWVINCRLHRRVGYQIINWYSPVILSVGTHQL
jgi:hypothetical protein